MALNHRTLAVIIAMAMGTSFPAWSYEQALEVYQQGNISYVTGGIGKDESAALRATQRNYNFQILNADVTGHFSGNTRIMISDLNHNVLLDVISGPIFYANLPKGRYIVEGLNAEYSKKKTVTIVSSKTVRLRFSWPQGTTNIDNY